MFLGIHLLPHLISTSCQHSGAEKFSLELSIRAITQQVCQSSQGKEKLTFTWIHLAGPNSNTRSVYQCWALDAFYLSMFCADWWRFVFSPKWRTSKCNGEVTFLIDCSHRGSTNFRKPIPTEIVLDWKERYLIYIYFLLLWIWMSKNNLFRDEKASDGTIKSWEIKHDCFRSRWISVILSVDRMICWYLIKRPPLIDLNSNYYAVLSEPSTSTGHMKIF